MTSNPHHSVAPHKQRLLALCIALAFLLVSTLGAAQSAPPEKSTEDWTNSEHGQALLQRTDEILDVTESFRGLGAKESVKKGLMLKEELRQILLTKLAEENEADQLDNEAKLLKRLGLIDPKLDYEAFLVDLLTEQIAGFYDDETKELYILEGQEQGFLDTVLSHELFHAIQDQQFTIGAIRAGGDDNADLLAARIALVEGDAVAVMIDFDLQPDMSFTDVPGFEAMMRSSVNLAGVASEMMEQAPLVLRESLVFPYIDGLLFVGEVKRKGGWDAVNQLYLDPPMSTEQVIHPEKYFDRDDPVSVHFQLTPALSEWKELYNDVNGELGAYLYLKQHLVDLGGDKAIAAPATTGWDGDRTLLLESESGQLCYVMLSVWDSEKDAKEAYDAFDTVSALRFSVATRDAFEGVNGDALLLSDTTEHHFLERRGTEVLYIEGFPDDPSAIQELLELRATIWVTRFTTEYPTYNDSKLAWETSEAAKSEAGSDAGLVE